MSLGALWDQSKSAVADLAEVASRSWRDVVADDVLARQEFKKSGELTREGLREFAEEGASRSATGNVVGGAALGLGAAASFVFPSGRGARVVGSGRGVARRAAAGVGDAFEGEGGRAIRPSDAGADVAAEMLREAVLPGSGVDAGPLPGRSGEPARLLGDVSVDDFERAITEVRKIEFTRPGEPTRSLGETVYQYPTEEYGPMRRYLSDDGLSGFAIKPDGDLVSVFSAPGLGRGGALVDAAVARGARKLDAFDEDGFLPRLYGSRGFVEVKREPWDPERKPDNWRGGEPDVVYMELPAGGSPARTAPSGPELDLPRSLLRDEGSYWADLPGTRVRELAEELVQRHVDSPQGISALEPREIAAVLEGLPEFSDFVRMYRETVLNRMTDPLDRRSMRAGALIDFAGMAGLAPPRWARGLDTSVSFPASVKGDLPEALRNGAANLAVRVRNMNTFANDDAYRPTFYVEFNRVLRAVEAETGMPIEALTSALASASSQAAPYDEVLRFARVAPMVRVRDGAAETVPGAVELLGSDRMAVTALRGLVDSVNNPDFLTVKPSGQAMKTSAYAYNRLDPLYMPVYVADTVDGVGQFLILGGDAGTSKAEKSIVNQIAGRTLANIYDVPNSAMQEATWGHIRLVRDGLKTTLTGNPTAIPIAPSFTGAKGHVEDVLVAAVKRMDDSVVRLARQNREKFYGQVRDGDVAAWDWDAGQRRPVISSSDYLIPADQRPVVSGRAMLLQNQMMALVEALGPNLRNRIVALASAIGVPAGVLGAAMGAALGAGQGVAQASDGEGVTLAAGPVGSSIAAGATVGAAVGGSFGILAAQALRAARSVRGFATRKTINPDVQVPLERENLILEDTFDAYRSQFINRTSGTKQNWESMPGTEGLPFLGDAPIGRLGKDYYQAIESVQWYMHGAGGGTGDLRRALLNDDVAVPFDLIQDNGPAFAGFVDGVLIRAFNGGPGGNVVFNATSDGAVLNGGALRGKYVVANVTDDFIDPVTYSFRDETIASTEGRRRILQGFRKMYAELGTGIQDDPRGVIYAYNTDDPSYLGFFQFTRKNVFGKETPDIWGPESSGLGYNEARELVFMGGTLADSQEEAFRLAAQRGQLFVKDAATGRNVRVPDSFVGESVQLERITIPPTSRGVNVAEQLDVVYDSEAPQFYIGRGTSDDVLNEIYRLQEFDKPTILVNDAEAQILIREHGYMPLYRGIEFEGLVDGYDTTALRNEILNSPVWQNDISPRVTSPQESESYIRQIIDAKKYYDAKYQGAVMDAWVNQRVLVSEWKDFSGLLSDIAFMQNSYTQPRALGAEWAEQIWGPLAKPENVFVPDQMVKEFASGKYYPGVGSHGSGTYATPNLQRAMGYGGIGTYDDYDMAKNGFVYGILLKPDAKIMGPAEYESFVNALRFWPNQVGYDDIGNKLASSPWGDELSKLFKVQEIDPGVFEYALRNSFADVGRAIAAIGYDGYIPHGTVYGYQKPEYVLLNRQSFVVVNHPIQPVTIDPFGVNSYDVSTFVGYPLIEVPLQ